SDVCSSDLRDEPEVSRNRSKDRHLPLAKMETRHWRECRHCALRPRAPSLRAMHRPSTCNDFSKMDDRACRKISRPLLRCACLTSGETQATVVPGSTTRPNAAVDDLLVACC